MRLATLAVTLTAVLAMTSSTTAEDKKPDTRVYEMRVYYANPGKFDDLNARFKNLTLKFFEKHGMTNVGYFVPTGENKDEKLVYFLSYPSKDAADKSWKALFADDDVKKAFAETEKNGKLVKKVESTYMTATEYSPLLKIDAKGDRVFELRTYTATKGNLGGLDARFKDHTIKLFEKHGMTNLIYWHLLPEDKNADKMLIYLMAHKSQDAAMESFAAFGKDPDWDAARKESEAKAGGPLTEPKGGVVREFLKPTDYSPLK